MERSGWRALLRGPATGRSDGTYPIAAYSEFMPPPRLVRSPYGAYIASPFREEDPWGWQVTEAEETFELQPGLEQVAVQLVGALARLGRGGEAPGIARYKRTGNPYWPDSLSHRAGHLAHERYVVLAPLALSRTQDDKGRVRWTLLGGSRLGPARAFWRGWFVRPSEDAPPDSALRFVEGMLSAVYGESIGPPTELRKAGFRILPQGKLPSPLPDWPEGPLPTWTAPFQWKPGETLRGVRYLLTFRPFSALPDSVQRAYLGGKLHLLPFPGSLLFWGVPDYLRLSRQLPPRSRSRS